MWMGRNFDIAVLDVHFLNSGRGWTLYKPNNQYIILSLCVQDVHSRYRTEAHQDVVGRFNER